MIANLIAYFHILLSFLAFTYVFWRTPTSDTYYLLFFGLLNISWIILKNECLLSYLYKAALDNNYKLGTTLNLFDFETIMGVNYARFFVYGLFIAFLLNLLVIATHSANKVPALALLASTVIYIYGVRTGNNFGNVLLLVDVPVVSWAAYLLYKR